MYREFYCSLLLFLVNDLFLLVYARGGRFSEVDEMKLEIGHKDPKTNKKKTLIPDFMIFKRGIARFLMSS